MVLKTVFEDNVQREAEYSGQEKSCDFCEKRDIVGKDIHAAFTIIHDGTSAPEWICQSCIDKMTLAC